MKNTLRPNNEHNVNFRTFSSGLKGTDPYGFLVSLPYRCYIPNLVKIGLVHVVLEKKMLMDNTRWTTTEAIAIGHLSDSGD